MPQRINLLKNKFYNNEFINSSLYSSFSVALKIITAFISSKFVAIHLGPEGMGLLGQLTNFITIATMFSGGILTNGIIKLTADYNANCKEKLNPLIQTSFSITLVSCFFSSILLLVGSTTFSNILLLNKQYSFIFQSFGVTIFFTSLNTYFLSLLNGFKNFRKYNFLNALSSIFSLIITILLIKFHGLNGALMALVLNQVFNFFIIYIFVRKESWFNYRIFKIKFDSWQLQSLGKISLMMLVTAVTVPVAQLLIRNFIIKDFGLQTAGIWESVIKISNVHLLFFLTVLTTYYLPKLSEIKSDLVLKKEIVSGYKITLPIILLSCLLIFLCKQFIIKLLYADAFLPAASLMNWQLIGDFFKIISYFLAFIMIARSLSATYIISEIIFSVLYFILVVVFTTKIGIQGATIAYAVNYIVYFVFLLVRFKHILFRN